jgi:hypothetical protein
MASRTRAGSAKPRNAYVISPLASLVLLTPLALLALLASCHSALVKAAHINTGISYDKSSSARWVKIIETINSSNIFIFIITMID